LRRGIFAAIKFSTGFYRGEISVLCILKIAAKLVQSHDKIGVKFYAERTETQRARIFCKIYDEISPPKARLRQPKACSKTKKPPPQNPHDEILPANFSW